MRERRTCWMNDEGSSIRTKFNTTGPRADTSIVVSNWAQMGVTGAKRYASSARITEMYHKDTKIVSVSVFHQTGC